MQEEHSPAVHYAHTVLGTPTGLTVLYASAAIDIRQQVMRGHRYAMKSTHQQVQLKSSAKDLTNRFRLNGSLNEPSSERSPRRKRRSRKESPTHQTSMLSKTEIAAASIDPFDMLPIPIYRAQSQLLHQVSDSVFFQHPIALTSEDSVLSETLGDAAFLNAILSMAALRQDLLRGYEVSSLALYHRGETIRIVRDRLTTAGDEISSATIAAVASMAAFDLMDSTVIVDPWNLNGLSKMIDTRGGFSNFSKQELRASNSQSLIKVITWLDVCFRTFQREHPPLVNAMPFSSFVSFDINGLSTPAIHTTEQLLDILSQLSVDLEHNTTSTAIQDVFSNTLVLVENYIYEQQERNRPDPFTDLCLTAASTYIYLFLRQVPINAGIYIRLTPKLRIALQAISRSSSNTIESDEAEVLLWAVFMGAITSKSALTARQNGEHNQQSQKWWIRHMRNIVDSLALQSLRDFEDSMIKVINMTTACRRWCTLIWNEIETAMSPSRLAGALP